MKKTVSLNSFSSNESLIFNALISISSMLSTDSKFTSTKEISFVSGLSIYQTRYTLLKLSEKGLVVRDKIEHKHRKQWALSHCVDRAYSVSNDDMFKKISNQ